MGNSNFTTLRRDNQLFIKLKDENPDWWQFVKENINKEGLYVDIRKDNSLNVYYNGGSVVKVELSKGEIKCVINERYLDKEVSHDPNCLRDVADGIIKRIRSLPCSSDTSENGIKAKLICEAGAKYIDSEFAYVDNDKTIRIDLTKLENKKIIFVELKRIEDGRLCTNEYEKGSPEILSQMKAYNKFIGTHKQEIIDYYKTLFSIKRDLGILPESLASIENIDDYELSEKVELYIEGYSAPYPTTRREKRVKAIKTILDEKHIKHNLCK